MMILLNTLLFFISFALYFSTVPSYRGDNYLRRHFFLFELSSQNLFSTITDHKEEKIPPVYDRIPSSINQLKEKK